MISKCAFLLVGILVFAHAAEATPVTLTDLNSTFSIEPTTQAGAYSWEIDGTQHLFKEWFWYRLGAAGRERSIDTLTFLGFAGTDTDADTSNVLLQYRHSNFTLDIEFDLTGSTAGSGTASIAETITITSTRAPNTGNIAMNFFAYTDFNLQGTPDDTATVVDPSTITQTDDLTFASSVTSVSPGADHYEVATGTTLLDSLNSMGNTPTTLSDTPTVGGSVGPDDVAFAFQWQEVIAPGVSFVINQEKSIVGSMTAIPEPGSLLLVASGLIGLQRWRRGRQHVS